MASGLLSSPPQVFFSSEVSQLHEWAQRTGLPLPTSAEALGTHYAKAHKWFMAMKNALINQHGWKDAQTLDSRMLFSIEFHGHRSSAGLLRSPVMTLTLPRHASSFFSPDRRIQWQMCFHGALFPAMRHTVQPVGDVLHLLQCLLPGMLVIAKVEKVPGEGVYKTSRGLPPAEWIDSNMEMLLDIFGPTHFRKLWRAASDKRIAFKVDIDPPELS